jgi:hypothetical protein
MNKASLFASNSNENPARDDKLLRRALGAVANEDELSAGLYGLRDDLVILWDVIDHGTLSKNAVLDFLHRVRLRTEALATLSEEPARTKPQ